MSNRCERFWCAREGNDELKARSIVDLAGVDWVSSRCGRDSRDHRRRNRVPVLAVSQFGARKRLEARWSRRTFESEWLCRVRPHYFGRRASRA